MEGYHVITDADGIRWKVCNTCGMLNETICEYCVNNECTGEWEAPEVECRICQGPIERTDDPGQEERTLCDWCEGELDSLMKECES